MRRVERPQRPRRLEAGSAASTVVAYGGHRHRPAWASEPERVAPVDVPLDRVLIDTPDLVVFVAAVRVYPSGFLFTLSSQLRPTASTEAEEAFAQEFSLGMRHHVPAAQAERSLRVGVRFADGRGGALDSNARRLPHVESEQAALPLVHTSRTSSDTAMADCEIRVAGLPAEGDVELFYRWLTLGVTEASIVIDGDALRSASARAVVLWDVPTEEKPGTAQSAGMPEAPGTPEPPQTPEPSA